MSVNSKRNDVRTFIPFSTAQRSVPSSGLASGFPANRERFRKLDLARTIIDLTGCDKIQTMHSAETIQHRPWQQVYPITSCEYRCKYSLEPLDKFLPRVIISKLDFRPKPIHCAERKLVK